MNTLAFNPSSHFKLHKVICLNPDNEDEVVLNGILIDEDYLVVNIEMALEQVFIINLDTTARFPKSVNYFELLSLIDEEKLLLADLELDPKLMIAEDDLPERFVKKAKDRLAEIYPLIQDLESVVRNGYGDNKFGELVQSTGRSKSYLYNCFYSWLRHGGRENCLGLPIGKDANHVPKKREIRVKQGAPNQDIPKGKVLDDFDFKVFEKVKKHRNRNPLKSIPKLTRWCWSKYYFESRVKCSAQEFQQTGMKFKIKWLPANQRPSEDQIRYWLSKQDDGPSSKHDRNKRSHNEYRASKAGRTGDPFTHSSAPGELYQLDETPFDEELVSEFDPTRTTKIGKGTLYFIREGFDEGIAGIYITTLPPSYSTVKEAVFNAARNKTGFLAEINCPIDPTLWPHEGIPQSLLVDRAEFHSRVSEGPITDFPMTIKFTRAGRGDDKGLIEVMFYVFSVFFKGLSKAHQTKSLHDIARQVARKNACLTINELYIIATIYAVHFNSVHVLNDYPLTREMARDNVDPIPNQIYHWGRKYRPGGLLEMSENEMYLRLLEKGTVSVHRTHLHLLDYGLRYNCQWSLEKGLQDRKESRNSAPRFSCRFFRGIVDKIFVCTNDGLKLATLDVKDQQYSGLSFPEVKVRKTQTKPGKALLHEAEQQSLASIELFLEETIKQATSSRVVSALPSIATIKENRSTESIFDRIRQANRYVTAIEELYLPSKTYQQNQIQNLPLGSSHQYIDIPDEVFDDHDEYADFYGDEES